MARTDIAGLLTGISSGGIDPVTAGSAEQQRLAFGAQRAQGVRRGLLGAMGKDASTPAEKLQAAMSQLNLNKTEDLKKLASIMQASGDFAGAAKIAATIGDRRKSQLRRDSLITQAKKLNLEDTADLLTGGGPLELAEKQILEAEERNIVSRQGRKGRAAVARSKGAGDVVIQGIMKGEYDNTSDTLFLEQLSGEKAENKFFQTTDSEGRSVSRPYPVNEAGQVLDPESRKWVYPMDLGLTQAPVTTQQLNTGNEVTQQLTQGFVDTFVELNSLGRQAEKMLEINRASALDLDKIYTGKLAPVQLAIMDVGKSLGVISPEQEDAVVATQTFMINRAKQVLPLIKALGSGTAISDKDREFIEKIVAGNISLSLDTIKRIIEIENEYAVKAITKSNGALDRLSNIKGADIDPSVVEGLYITAPSFSPRVGVEISPDAQSVIERARERARRNTGIR